MGKYWNMGLHILALVGGTAAAIVAVGPLGIVPAVVVGVAMKAVGIAGVIGVIAAKIAPGIGQNAPAPAGSVTISAEAAATQIKP